MLNQKRLILLFLIIGVALESLLASSIIETNYPVPGTSDSATQIWIPVGNYDSKTSEFVLDPDAESFAGDPLSGSAYYFPTLSGTADVQQWYAEYTINDADVNATLSGTWYFWARAVQPIADGVQDSAWLLVKGDDAAGETWNTTALSGAVAADDRILDGVGAQGGVGKWIWIGSNGTDGLREKNFVIENGKITFRIYERESGPLNPRIDMIMWTNNSAYIPSDADFLDKAVEVGLILSMDASQAGDTIAQNWKPLVGPDQGGTLASKGAAPLPQPLVESVTGGYNWFYKFVATSSANAGLVSKVDSHGYLNFDHNDLFTIDAWIRVQDKITADSTGVGRGVIIANQASTFQGWHFGVRDYAGTHYYFEMLFRMPTSELSNGILLIANSTRRVLYGDTWTHVVYVNSPGDPDGMHGKIYVDGILAVDMQVVPWFTPNFVVQNPESACIGNSNVNIYPFDGNIAIVRVYNRALSIDEIVRNYDAGLLSNVSSQCGGQDYDYNNDCAVTLVDFAELASEWLHNNLIQ